MDSKTNKFSATCIKYLFGLLAVTILILYALGTPYHSQLNVVGGTLSEYPEDAASQYLVYSSRCQIPNLNLFNNDTKPFYKKLQYISCTKLPLLTYITVNDNNAILHINQSIATQYSKNGVSCCYSSVTRKKLKTNPDKKISISACTAFKDNVTLPYDFITVKCNQIKGEQVYKNAHAAVTKTKNVEKKLNTSSSGKHLSVLLIGIDSVSRLNLIRGMPETHSFLKKYQWLELRGYNKIADNTFPNWMALLSGMNQGTADKKCKPTKIGYLDKCKLIWYSYRKLGYVTAYAEDETSIATFNYHKKGFVNPPTDYYFRPYMIAAESELKTVVKDHRTYCTGPEVSGERVLHLALDFARRFSQHPYFGLFWMNTFSHDDLNAIQRMDNKVYDFLQELRQNELLNNTVIVLFSDHGFRFGDFRRTYAGRLEDRLPAFFVSFPEWFKVSYTKKYNNLVTNQNRLTTPYDVYMTLQELLVISGKKYSVTPSTSCPKCKSLFEEMDVDRACEDASIEEHWCTCSRYTKISTKNSTVEAASKHILNDISQTINSYGSESAKCAKFKLRSVKSSSILENENNWYKNDTYLRIVLETVPNASFEGTVKVKLKEKILYFKTQGSISRLDYYQPHSDCVHDATLKKYCYCNM